MMPLGTAGCVSGLGGNGVVAEPYLLSHLLKQEGVKRVSLHHNL